jgi:hypothetical protein
MTWFGHNPLIMMAKYAEVDVILACRPKFLSKEIIKILST